MTQRTTPDPKVQNPVPSDRPWPIRPYADDARDIEDLRGRMKVSRSALLRGLVHLGLRASRVDTRVLLEAILTPKRGHHA